MTKACIVLLSAAACLLATPADAQFLTNGGLNMLAGDEGKTLSISGGNSYGGWTNSGGTNIEFVGVQLGLGPSAEGNGFVDLNGVQGPGRISQTFATTTLQQYRINFSLSGNPGVTGDRPNDKPMSLLWNGGVVQSYTFDQLAGDTHSNLRWESYSAFVTGTGTDTLTFASTGGYSDAGAMIDKVTVTAVPEPGAVVFLGFGGILLAACLRQKVSKD
ncbi:MAG TPA: DUF642 domain-containing protein [Chthoniobacterales bacterium]|jgi:hypothetical protein